jgi:sigma-E factor negative regulatory protein RseC
MLHETGLVADLIGDLAIVQTQNQLACSSCKVVDTCGNGIVEKYLSGKIFSSEVYNRLNAKVGDKVVLEIPKASVTKASVIVYLIPLLSFILFASVASLFSYSENIIILISLFGLALGFVVTKFYNRRFLINELYLPKMVSIVNTGSVNSYLSTGHKSSDIIDINQI